MRKDADQLRSNCAADQRLCFRYTESTITLLPKSEISSLLPSFVAVQTGLCRIWSETPTAGFLTTRPIWPLLAHLSRWLIDELIVYQWSGVRRRRPSTFSNISFSKTAKPIKAKFYVEPPWVGERKFVRDIWIT